MSDLFGIFELSMNGESWNVSWPYDYPEIKTLFTAELEQLAEAIEY